MDKKRILKSLKEALKVLAVGCIGGGTIGLLVINTKPIVGLGVIVLCIFMWLFSSFYKINKD